MAQSTIRAFQSILTNYQFDKTDNWAEEFAIKRFRSKMETPDHTRNDSRVSSCWQRFLVNDNGLPIINLPSREWYIARSFIHDMLKDFKLGPVEFSTGSQFTPTHGFNSIEAKLCCQWDCTIDNFDAFASTCYSHKALKRAAKVKFKNLVTQSQMCPVKTNRKLYVLYKDCKDMPFRIFRHKLRLCINVVYGSRFTTVPKNNEKDRPINIEPFGNILTQKRIGNGLRNSLNSYANIDLNSLQEVHRLRIKDLSIATIDLRDASDSISCDLVRFLLPRRVYSLISDARSPMILGLDKNYHILKKVSSMGNGFTFELMSVILTAICRTLDDEATVYGDDIIISATAAPRLIELLNEVGFSVNTEKSFITGPFRESCGGNYHRDYGYIESFDFKYPINIHDCVVLYNKCSYLALYSGYGQFAVLERVLRRAIPSALRGVWAASDLISIREKISRGSQVSESPYYELSGYFRCPISTSPLRAPSSHREFVKNNFHTRIVSMFMGYKFKAHLRSSTSRHLNPRRHWAKYEMYLHSGRRAKDVVTGRGDWVKCAFYILNDGCVIKASCIKSNMTLENL